jgi:hypothetical protein
MAKLIDKKFQAILTIIILANIFYLTVYAPAATKAVALRLSDNLQLNEKQKQKLFIEVAPQLQEPWGFYHLINTIVCVSALLYFKNQRLIANR